MRFVLCLRLICRCAVAPLRCLIMTILPRRRVLYFILGCAFVLLMCEFLIYYMVLLQCHWPDLNGSHLDLYVPLQRAAHPVHKSPSSGSENEAERPLRVMLLADTHLLGVRQGHWFDRLRREWAMERAFQTAMFIHNPNIVFFLGDVFDEGKWASEDEFQAYTARFQHIFRHWSARTKVQVIMGNHDVGFHYDMANWKVERMQRRLNATPSVVLWTAPNSQVHFVMLNSMAMEGDGCQFCKSAEKLLGQIAHRLNCLRGDDLSMMSRCADQDVMHGHALHRETAVYSRPILLQHFPLYRRDDTICPEDLDASNGKERSTTMRPKWDALSPSATEMLLEKLKPRLVFAGHTHRSCVVEHKMKDGVSTATEFNVASFSWRNIDIPSFLLLKVTSNDYAVSKCFLPRENTVIGTYYVAGSLLVLWLCWPLLLSLFRCLPRLIADRKRR